VREEKGSGLKSEPVDKCLPSVLDERSGEIHRYFHLFIDNAARPPLFDSIRFDWNPRLLSNVPRSDSRKQRAVSLEGGSVKADWIFRRTRILLMFRAFTDVSPT